MTVRLHSDSNASAAVLAGSEERAVKQAICDEVCRLVPSQYSPGLRSIVLAGSMARDEATIEREAHKLVVLGDADFFLIFNENAREPSPALLEKTAHDVEAALAARGVQVHIGLNSVRTSYLRRLPAYIATYELRLTGAALWGDPNILSLIPSFPASQISKEDAWRMLCNRLIEFLEHVPDFSASSDEVSRDCRYATMKLTLDIATSYLVFIGEYEPTYRARAARLRAWSIASTRSDALSFPLPEFTELVSRCTEWKLSGVATVGSLPWRRVLAFAHALWRWELMQLTGAAAELSDHTLWARWSRQQTYLQRLRGWLSVARRCSWRIRLKEGTRWTRLAKDATPRYCVYRVAAALSALLASPAAPSTDIPGISLGELYSFLPELIPSNSGWEWRRLAANVVWNYKRFLVGTLA